MTRRPPPHGKARARRARHGRQVLFDFTYTLLTRAGFTVQRKGVASALQVGDTAVGLVSSTTELRCAQRPWRGQGPGGREGEGHRDIATSRDRARPPPALPWPIGTTAEPPADRYKELEPLLRQGADTFRVYPVKAAVLPGDAI